MKKPIIFILTLLICGSFLIGQALAMGSPAVSAQSGGGNEIFLPLVRNFKPTPTPTNPPPAPVPTSLPSQNGVRVNMPYFSGDAADHFTEAAIFWFGKVSPSENYADIRFAYDNNKLWVYISTFDQYMWYNTNPSSGALTAWDSATLQINLNGNSGSSLDTKSYKFDAAMSWGEPRAGYQASYHWTGSQWAASSQGFTSFRGYDGFFNDNTRGTRGWALTFDVPFSGLGLSSKPADGTTWGISMTMHDRDSAAGPALADKSWPVGFQASKPSSWAQLRFGLPNYGAVSGTVAGTDLIRRDRNRGIVVPDAGLGGTTPNLCPGDTNYIFNTWGNTNLGSHADFNIQNQSNVADWPCFSKYYVTFPLTTIPQNKKILSARLILHHQGSAGDPGQAKPSLIQVFTVAGDWAENTITWNNAPPAQENISRTLVNIPQGDNYGNWPKIPIYWDITAAAAQAYQAGQPLRLALYEADSDFHSGKYFTSSDSSENDPSQDWNIAGRPSLEIKWGN